MSKNLSNEVICPHCDRSFTLRTNMLRHLALVHGVNEHGDRADNKTLRRYKNYNRKKNRADLKLQDLCSSTGEDDDDGSSLEDHTDSCLPEYDDDDEDSGEEDDEEEDDTEEVDDGEEENDDKQVNSKFTKKMEDIMNSGMGENVKFMHYARILGQYWNATKRNTIRPQTTNATERPPITEDRRRTMKKKHRTSSSLPVGSRRIRSRARLSSWLPY